MFVDSLDVAMAGDGDGGDIAIAAVDRVHGDDAFRRALPEKVRILSIKSFRWRWLNHKIEIAFLKKVVFHAG
jgi:hypothetical protein